MQSIRKRSFGDQPEATYVKIHFRRDGLTMILLERKVADYVRRLLTTDQAARVLDELKCWDGALEPHWKARDEAIRKVMEHGDPFGYARVFKGLTRMAASSELRPQDRQNRQRSLELLSEELALSLGKTRGQASELITRASEA